MVTSLSTEEINQSEFRLALKLFLMIVNNI